MNHKPPVLDPKGIMPALAPEWVGDRDVADILQPDQRTGTPSQEMRRYRGVIR